MSSGSLFWSVSRYYYSWRKIGAWFAPNVPQAWKSFWAHPMVLLGVVSHVEVVLVLAQIGARFALNVPQARKSFWAHSMVLLANVGQEEARFDPPRDSNKSRRKIGARFAPNVTRA